MNAAARPGSSAGGWLVAFILVQLGGQLLLAFGDVASMRVAVRASVFGLSALLLVLIPPRGRSHPATAPALLALAILGLSLLHPATMPIAGTAQAAMYTAILAPLFWAPRMEIDFDALARVFMILWLYQTASALAGVLQVSFPGFLQPNVSSVILAQGESYVNSLKIATVGGELVLRPMGFTDQPGGAAAAGFYAILLGAGFLVAGHRARVRVAAVVSLLVGITVIYLSQVRSTLVMTAIAMVAFAAVLVWRRRIGKAAGLAAVLAVVAFTGLGVAVEVAGESVTNRLTTLIDAPPAEVYYENRGFFVEHTVENLLPRYPFGAGVGRWGMMNAYFAGEAPPESGRLWVEIQWTGWLFDGGVPLVFAYLTAVLVALSVAWRLTRASEGGGTSPIWLWAALVFGYDVGSLALTFNYPLFIGERGLEFWLLNGALFAAASTEAARRGSRSETWTVPT